MIIEALLVVVDRSGWSVTDLAAINAAERVIAAVSRVCELLTVSEGIRQLIARRDTAGEIRAATVEEGMSPMQLDGVEKVIAGLTTIEDVARVTVDVA